MNIARVRLSPSIPAFLVVLSAIAFFSLCSLLPRQARAAVITGMKKGTGTIANGSASTTMAIIPTLTDRTKTMLFFQATSTGADPHSTAVRCTITNTTTITCDRYDPGSCSGGCRPRRAPHLDPLRGSNSASMI